MKNYDVLLSFSIRVRATAESEQGLADACEFISDRIGKAIASETTLMVESHSPKFRESKFSRAEKQVDFTVESFEPHDEPGNVEIEVAVEPFGSLACLEHLNEEKDNILLFPKPDDDEDII